MLLLKQWDWVFGSLKVTEELEGGLEGFSDLGPELFTDATEDLGLRGARVPPELHGFLPEAEPVHNGVVLSQLRNDDLEDDSFGVHQGENPSDDSFAVSRHTDDAEVLEVAF